MTGSDASHLLQQVALDSWYAKGANGAMIRYCGSQVFSRYFRGTRCLELGPAEGLMSAILTQRFPDLTLVEGAPLFAQQLRQNLPTAHVVESLFENYEPSGLFDTIVLGHVLEHLESPDRLLARIGNWLAPEGVILAAVPNARSLHRQAAVIMGLLEEEHALNDSDRHHGHHRVYDPESFRAEFLRARLRIDVFGGYWIKPVSNRQIDETWNDQMLDAFMRLGERYPDIAAEIYVVASRRTDS